MLPVSHAFHTSIVAPASEPLRHTLERLELRAPEIPIVANVTGGLYPMGPDVVARDARLAGRPGGLAGPVRARICARSTTRALACSWRSARRRPCRASPPTSSATTSSPWRRTTPSSATRPPSTRHCAGSTRRASASVRSTRRPCPPPRRRSLPPWPARSTMPRQPPSRSSSRARPSACRERRTSSTTPTSPASCTASRGST